MSCRMVKKFIHAFHAAPARNIWQTTQSLPTSELLLLPTVLLSWWREKEHVVLALVIPSLLSL